MNHSDAESAHRRRRGSAVRDDADEPDTPSQISKASWRYLVRRTTREFIKDGCTDLAAALTYYAVLALFPAAIALMSLVGLFGQRGASVKALTNVLSDAGAGSVAHTITPTLQSLSHAPGAGFALVFGLLGALWTASGYVGAFGRAMNRMYEVGEGRPIWKLRPAMLLVTLVLLVLVAAALLALVVSGPVAESIGKALDIGSTAVLVWQIAKWPALLFVVVLIVGILYYTTPNIKQPKFRWLSIGALVAIVVWLIASAGFGFYVVNFSRYNKTYGALAGVIVFLLWLWITNLALLFGAELDAELERARELQGGLAAEDTLQLPPRDDRNIQKNAATHREDVRRGRELRQQHDEARETATEQ